VKGLGRKWSWPISRYYLGIHVERLSKSTGPLIRTVTALPDIQIHTLIGCNKCISKRYEERLEQQRASKLSVCFALGIIRIKHILKSRACSMHKENIYNVHIILVEQFECKRRPVKDRDSVYYYFTFICSLFYSAFSVTKTIWHQMRG
jgi:hypothetical protein